MNDPILTRRSFLRFGGLGAAGAIVFGTCAGLIQRHNVVVEHHEIGLTRLPKELDGLRIAHLSDFHYASEVDGAVIREAVRLTTN